MVKHRYAYCIFYLEKKYWKDIPVQLQKAGYRGIKSIVPTISLLRRNSRGEMIFEEHPILFNYGFMRMPMKLAYSRPFLIKMRKDIPGIHAWLKDTATLHPRKKRHRIDNAEDFDDFSMVATCSKELVIHYKKLARKNKKYTLDDLVNIKPGDYITLKGYPYEGQNATVLKVNYRDRTVTVEILVIHGTMKLKLPFDNVLYSVYMNYDPDVVQASFINPNEERITQERIDDVLNRRRL